MASMESRRILQLVRSVARKCTLDYEQELEDLNLKKQKRSVKFFVKLSSMYIKLSDFDVFLKKRELYVSVKVSKLSELLEFVRFNKIDYIAIINSEAKCVRKWFSYWDYPSLKMYTNCKNPQPLFGYCAWPDKDCEIEEIIE